MKDKSVLIKRHKGYEVRYKDEKFYVAKKGRRVYISNYDKEEDAKKVIDKLVEEKKKQLEEAKKIKSLEQENKKLLKTKAIVDGKSFKDMITRIGLLSTEVPLSFKNKILSITAMDPANVCLMHSKIPYEGTANNLMVGINASVVLQCLVGKQEEEITLSFKLVSTGEKKLVITSTLGSYQVPTIDIEKEEKVPDLKYKSKAKLEKDVYEQTIKQGGNAAESITFIIKNKKLLAEAKGDTVTYTKEIGKAVGKNAKAKFSIEYLKRPYFKNSKEVLLEFNNDYPLRVTDEGGNWLLLAPRVNGEDC